jgi:Ca2+-binding RTX toxin-like protein
VLGAAISAIAAGMLTMPAASSAAADSEGTEFWLAFPGNYVGGGDKTLFITGREAASGTVEVPGLAFSTPFTVTPGAVTSVPLPSGAELSGGEGTQARGIHVTADKEVGVYGLNRIQFTTDAYLGLPADVLGTEHIVLGYGTGQSSQLAVAASQDATTVTITPSVNGAGGRTAGTPYDITLNRGDAYQLRAAAPPQDLTGSLISSDKPVSVYGGNQCANIPNSGTGFCDYVVEQIPPNNTWGTSFLTVPLKTRTAGDTFRILAAEDGTDVSINGAAVATLNRGQFHEQQISGQSTISSNKPVLVAQYSNGTQFDGVTSDPFEMLIPPTEQFLDRYTVTTPASGFAANFINLVASDSDTANIAIDGTPVGAGAFAPIGSSGFSGSQNDVALGSHTLTGTRPFGAYQYGFDRDDSYGYPGGQSFAPIADVAELKLEPAAATHIVGSDECVNARPLDSNGGPVRDVRIDFEVSGANPLAAFFNNADQSGNALMCYKGENLGDDTITARLGALSATATKSWVEVLPAPLRPEGCGLSIDGVDRLGDDAKNVLEGTSLTDRLRGGGGADRLRGAEVADCLRGDAGNDKITGDSGGDVIRGGADKDRISGGEGADDIRAQNGDDKVNGGPGDDTIKAQARGTDEVKCGTGEDRVIGDVKDTIDDDCERVRIVDPRKL